MKDFVQTWLPIKKKKKLVWHLHVLNECVFFKDVEHLQLPFTSEVFVWSDKVWSITFVMCSAKLGTWVCKTFSDIFVVQ